MNAIKFALRKNFGGHIREFHKCITARTAEAAAAPAVEKMQIPVPEGVEKPINPKLDTLVTEIAALNLIEVSELSDLLKKRLNLPDAPMMPMGGFMAAAPKEESEAPKAEKTSFTVKLLKFDDSKKVALIKEIKNIIPEMNLVQAKKFVEGIPNIIKEDISKEEANELQTKLKELGGVVEIS